jgi:predicted unusual protein kinase regulating ubiquinone biosynthesis (AarF/ABC1/UbiB family)
MTAPTLDLPVTPLPRPAWWQRTASSVDAALVLAEHALGRFSSLIGGLRRDTRAVATQAVDFYDLLGAQARQLAKATRDLPRLGRVLGELGRLLASYRLARAQAGFLSDRRGQELLEAWHLREAARARDVCVELGAGVLKLGQFASCRADLLPPVWIEALRTLQDRVPPEPWEAIEEVLKEELGRPLEEIFARFDREPLAAASLAQVYAAEFPDGTQVAVKVQRPQVARLVSADVTALRAARNLLGDGLPQVDLGTIVEEVARVLHEELDFLAEARQLAAFHARFAANARVVVPRPHLELSTRRVIVMDRIAGERLSDWLEAASQAGDAALHQVLGTLVDAYAAQVLSHGVFQADPHPGNFLVCEGGRLALLDFGAVETLGPAERRAYAELVGHALSGNLQAMAERLHFLGFRTADQNPETMRTFAELTLEAFKEGARLSDLDPRAQLERALELTQRHGRVDLPRHFVMLGRVLVALGGLLMRYRPNLDLFRVVAPHLADALAPRAPVL